MDSEAKSGVGASWEASSRTMMAGCVRAWRRGGIVMGVVEVQWLLDESSSMVWQWDGMLYPTRR